MGYNSRAAVVLQFLGALEGCLAAQGLKFKSGASVSAANDAYAS